MWVSSSAFRQTLNQPEEENFREILIFPSIEELLDKSNPILRPNITKGPYEDVDHYLDVQFRVLREDFIASLRDGIQDYRTKRQSDTSKYKDMWIHEHVKIGDEKYDEPGVLHQLIFNDKHFSTVKWDSAKRFMHGSLLCLSNDNFETVISAVVAPSNPKDLEKGIVLVNFEGANSKLKGVYSAAELPTFFGAYRPVLEGLQRFNKENLPMQKYIIKAQSRLDPPTYLNRSTRYKFSIRDGANLISGKVFDMDDWPSEVELNLDDSQRKAMHLALSSELAVIQGPPGTGKTHVALKIMQTLLNNQDVWRGKQKCGPILVVSMTNRALDQFLEGVLDFTQSIIRVGGGSESEKLEKYSLKAVQDRMKRNKRVGEYSGVINQLRWQLRQLRRSILAKMLLIEKVNSLILDENVVEYMPDWNQRLVESLKFGFDKIFELNSVKTIRGHGLFLKTWLGLTLDSMFVSNEELDHFLHDGQYEVDKVCKKIKAVLGLRKLTLNEVLDPRLAVVKRKGQVDVGDRIEIKFARVPGASDFQRNCRTVNVECLDVAECQNGKSKSTQLLVHCGNLRIAIVQNVKSDVMTDEEVGNVRNVWTLALKDRWRLYLKCRNDWKEIKKSEIAELEAKYEWTAEKLREMVSKERCSILRQCDVIGMTTTGAAKHADVLSFIKPKIVVVEEAARVFESHIICALTFKTQHLILIGDHKQLRAQVNVHRLSEECHLDISLFERLINNGVGHATLQVQHRMRPEISGLLVPFIYQNLRNHPNVLEYPQIKGVKSNMFFLNHNVMENKMRDIEVHANTFEAAYLVALCRYLLQQSYQPSQITIITAYNGQLNELQKRMKTNAIFEGVRVTSIDGFQGEESDIVLLSFVRNNIEGRIGFLKFDNRVNVALSRAKMGLFCVGNFHHFAKRSKFWRSIVDSSKKDGLVGNEMILKCQEHGTLTKVATAKQLKKLCPEGGCLKICGHVLSCNHVCKRRCHADPHGTLCNEPCIKVICDLKHSCPLKCFEECKPCVKQVLKRHPDCGHSELLPCCVDINMVVCVVSVERKMLCGHSIVLKCHNNVPSYYRCVARVVRKLPSCGHSNEMFCFENANTKSCYFKCGKVLDCTHVCTKLCHKDLHSKLQCTEPCMKEICDLKHACPLKCFEKCKPCVRQVLKRHPDCEHSELQPCCVDIKTVKCVNPLRRQLQCGHSITLECHMSLSSYQCCTRVDRQLPSCGHFSEMFCYEDARTISCQMKCNYKLDCGHVCPRKCHLLHTANSKHEKIKCKECRSKCVLS